MLKRHVRELVPPAPQYSGNTVGDEWDMSAQPVSVDWGANPAGYERTGFALLGQENLGSAATSRAMDSVSGFMSRDTWGPDGRVVGAVQQTQSMVKAVHGFTDSGVGKLAGKLPGVGRYVRAAHKGAELATAASDAIDSFGGAQGIAKGVEGAMRDPRAALDMVVNGGGRSIVEGAKAAAGSLAEQVGVGEMSPEGRFQAKWDIGRMATVGAELFATGGTSVLAMATEAGVAGMTQSIRSAQEYARTMPGQLANIPQLNNNDPWTTATPRYEQWNQGAQSTAGAISDSDW